MTRRIAISSGHGLHIRGARGSPVPPQLDEVDQARRVVDRVASKLGCPKFHDNVSDDQSENLNRIVNWHNSQSRDLDVSVHFNAYDHTAHGTEVLYVTQKTISQQVAQAIVNAGGFTLRGDQGAVYRNNLSFLNNTTGPAILIETCFCDHTGDSNAFNAEFEAICTAIAESISGQDLEAPVEPPIEATGENGVDITATTDDHVSVICNEALIIGHEGCEHTVKWTITTKGDVVVVINGEEFHDYPPAR